jgi:lipopolysaccharide transport system ATP-binding protein
MSDVVIQVENLGKKYIIGHQKKERYTALRDVLGNGAREMWQRLRYPGKSFPDPCHEEFWALKDVSFEVKQGDRVGIIGRNGAGKSTLLKILSRITEPTTGSIRIKGRVASLLEVGTGFHPELTGRENIYLNGAILGMGRDEIKRKFDEIVDFAEIEKFLDTPVKRYSSGMYVRLAFAVAAHLEPEILLVDEVLAVGDAQFQKKCLGKMEDVSKEGRTILFVSHNAAVIKTLCEKGLYFDKGKLVKADGISECLSIYIDENGQRLGIILDRQIVKSPGLEVIDIKVNNKTEDKLYFDSNDKELKVEARFVSSKACKVSLYGSLKDNQGQTIGIYSPGHMNGDVHPTYVGEYKISGNIILPKLTKGRYFLDLGIVEPGVDFYVYFPFAVELDSGGTPTLSGIVYEQGVNDAGYQIIDGKCSLESK